MTPGNGEGGQILADRRAALHEGQHAHPRKLVHETVAGDKRPVLHRYVATQQRAIGQDHVAAEMAVMGHMRAGHEKIMRAQYGVFREFVGPMNGNVFVKHIVVADPSARSFTMIFQILRRIANDRARVKYIMTADHRAPR